MTDQIQNKVITIQGSQSKATKGGGMRYVITDQDNQNYGFFTTKQDGNDTQVYAQWKNMQLGMGKTVRIGFVLENYTNSKGISVQSKKIINFQEAGQPDVEVPQVVQDAHGKKLGVFGMVNARLINHTIDEVRQEVPDLIALEEEIIKQLNGDEDVSSEDVPF